MPPKKAVTPTVFSFFSGAGFLDLGFEDAGFEVAFANEYDPAFAHAYIKSRERLGKGAPKYGVRVNSVEEWLTSRMAAQLTEWVTAEKKRGSSVGFIGGPPCPDFSVGGKNRGRHGENGRLTQSYFELIVSQRPDWFLFENVKGLWRTKRHRQFFDEMEQMALAAGYSVSARLINSIEYGVAQDRDRIIMVGLSEALVRKLELPHSSPSRISEEYFPWHVGRKFDRSILSATEWPTTAKFGASVRRPKGIVNELTVAHWFGANAVENHPNAKHVFQPRAGLARFKTVEEGDDSRKSYKRLHRYRYSPTAAYGNNEVHLHPTEPRRLTVAEALAIQSLPREYALPDDMTLSAMFKTVGNGVPYLAANGLAQMIRGITG